MLELKKYLEGKNYWEGMDLQLFAEPEGAEGKDNKDPNKDEPKGDPKTYTDDEVKAMIQKEADRRVTEALKKKEEKTKDEIAEAKKEALELAKLSEKERIERERQKEIDDFKKEKAEFQREKLKLEAQQDLVKKGLNPIYAEFLVKDDAEKTLKNINAFDEQYRKDLEEGIKAKLKGKTPDKPESGSSEINPWKKSTFNLTQQALILKTDPEKAKRMQDEVK